MFSYFSSDVGIWYLYFQKHIMVFIDIMPMIIVVMILSMWPHHMV